MLRRCRWVVDIAMYHVTATAGISSTIYCKDGRRERRERGQSSISNLLTSLHSPVGYLSISGWNARHEQWLIVLVISPEM